MITNGIFGHSSELKDRLIPFEEIGEAVQHLRALKIGKIVVTQGSYDVPHIGHLRYLAKARSQGDVLIVGVDSDEKIRFRKGKNRPVFPQKERLAMLAGFRPVDMLVLKERKHPKWALLKAVQPDVLVVSETTKQFKEAERKQLEKLCNKLVVLPPQAEGSTSARVRHFQLETASVLGEALTDSLTTSIPGIIQETISNVIHRSEK